MQYTCSMNIVLYYHYYHRLVRPTGEGQLQVGGAVVPRGHPPMEGYRYFPNN